MAISPPHGQIIILDAPLAEYLLVATLRLFRLSKVIAKVSSDKFSSGASRSFFRSAVDVGDLAVGRDGNQRVKAGFDQTAIVGVRNAQGLVRPLLLSNVVVQQKMLQVILPSLSRMGETVSDTSKR